MMAGGVNRTVAMIAGAVLVLVGLLGFFNDPILGLFETNALHNIIHLVTGAALLGSAFVGDNRERTARMTLLTFGVIYAVVTLLGFVAPGIAGSIFGDDGTNNVGIMPDNILHLLLTVVFLAVPLLVKEDVRRPMTTSPRI